jgi:hypothetical protein
VAHRQRAHHAKTGRRRDGESGELEWQANAHATDDGRRYRRDGQQPESQRCRHDLGDAQQRG